jgi:hypothetical protein
MDSTDLVAVKKIYDLGHVADETKPMTIEYKVARVEPAIAHDDPPSVWRGTGNLLAVSRTNALFREIVDRCLHPVGSHIRSGDGEHEQFLAALGLLWTSPPEQIAICRARQFKKMGR